MSDSRLQELHRAWLTSGASADRAAYLRERVRLGALTEDRLRLAAHCGDDGAQLATGLSPPAGFPAWAKELQAQGGIKAVLRYALTLAVHGDPEAPESSPTSGVEPELDRGVFHALVEAGEEWLAHPSEATARSWVQQVPLGGPGGYSRQVQVLGYLAWFAPAEVAYPEINAENLVLALEELVRVCRDEAAARHAVASWALDEG